MNKTMRRLFFITLICVLAVSCTGKGEHGAAADSPSAGLPADSSAIVLEARPHVGAMQSRVYQGTCEHDATCILTLFNYEYCGDGVFSLTVFGSGNELSVYKGRVYTLRGTDDATLWQCVTADGNHTFHFLVDADGRRIYKERNDADYTRKYVLSALAPEEP